MTAEQLNLEEALTIIEGELEKLSNEDVVSAILAWDNNPFTEEKMGDYLLQNSKESNIKNVIERLKKRYDSYVVSYINFFSVYKNNIRLNDDLQGIVDDVFADFKLTNSASERELNRSLVEKLVLDDDFTQSIYNYINERLIDFIENDEDIESLISAVFAAVMVDMLYYQSSPLDWNELKNARLKMVMDNGK